MTRSLSSHQAERRLVSLLLRQKNADESKGESLKWTQRGMMGKQSYIYPENGLVSAGGAQIKADLGQLWPAGRTEAEPETENNVPLHQPTDLPPDPLL